MGSNDAQVTETAELAGIGVAPPPDPVAEDRRFPRLLRTEALALYEVARHRAGLGESSEGFYNANVRVESVHGPVIVHMPVPGADVMDLRIWPETEVLRRIAPYVPDAPRLRFASAQPAFQVYEFLDGEQLNQLAPRGRPVPIMWFLTWSGSLQAWPLYRWKRCRRCRRAGRLTATRRDSPAGFQP